nr:hypothetical protein TgIa.0390 [Toxoplasma gondii RH]
MLARSVLLAYDLPLVSAPGSFCTFCALCATLLQHASGPHLFHALVSFLLDFFCLGKSFHHRTQGAAGTVRSISPAPQDAERSLASRGHFLPEKRPEQNGWQLAAGAGHQSRPDVASLTHALSGSQTEESPRTEAALAGEVRSAGSRVLEHVVASPVKEASIRVSQEAPDVSLKKSRTLAERFFLISSPPKAPKAETRSAQDNEEGIKGKKGEGRDACGFGAQRAPAEERGRDWASDGETIAEREEGLDLTGGDDHVGTSSQQVKQSSFGEEPSDPATSWERGESAASLESLFRGRSLQQKKKRWWAGLASSLGRRSRSVECGRRGGDAAEGRGAEESEKGRLPQDTPGSRSGPQSAAELRKETREGRGVRDEPGENESDLWRRPASPEEDVARKERRREKRERETLDESSSGFLPMTELLKGQGEGRAGRTSDSSFVSSRASTKKSVTTKLSRSLSRLFGGKKKKTKGKERAGEQADGTSEGRRHSADGGPRQAHGRRDSSTSVSSLSSRSGPSTDLSRSSSPCSPCFSASQWEEAFSSLPPIPPSVAALSDTCQDLLLDQLKVLERGVQQLLAGQGSDVVLACIADEPRISEVMKPNQPSGSAYRSQLLVDEKGHDEGGDLSRQGAVEGACTGERREGNSRGGGELGEGEASLFFSPERAQKVCRRSQIPRAVGRLREELTAEHTASIQLLTDERNRLVLNKLLVGIHEVRGLVRTFTDVSRDAQGEAAEILADAAQLRAWSAKHGELAEGRDLVEHYHRQVAESANGVIREYHRRCIQLNSDIQLMRDQISQVVHAAFLEASRLPPLHSLYASSSERNCVDAFLSSCPYSGDPRIFMVSPPFLSRLQLYALSHLPPSRSAHAPDSPAESPTGAVASSTASSLHVGRHAVVVPVSSSALFQPGRCVQSVPPGLLLRSSKEDLAALEHRLEGKWGSFNLFEAWQNDAMKWQWRDAMMQRNFATREEEIERWRRDSEARVLAAVDLRLQELWAGRMQELRRVAGENLEDSFVSLLVDRVPSVADVVQRVQQKRRATGSASLSSASSLSCFHFASALAAGVSNEEVEAAFLAAEDMRSRLVEVASSEVFRQLLHAQQIVADYREGKSREKLLGVLEETVGKQMREICHLRTRLEEESDLACQPDRIRDECQKTEAAITMLEEELIAMQEKRTLRQQRLLDLRDSAQTKLQRVTALFDDDQALCRSLEEQCAGERRRGERVERLWQEIGIEKLEEMKQELARLKGENVALQADLEVARFELDVKRKKEELKREEAQRRQAEAARKQQEMREKKGERERKKRALKERDVAERDDAAETQSQRKSPLDSSGLIVRWHKATSSPLPTGPGSQAGNEGEKKHEREAYGVEEWEADRASDSQGMPFSRASTSKRVGHFSSLFKWPSSKRSSSTPAELRTREGESGCEDAESPNGEGPHLRATAIQAASQRPVDSGVGEAHKTSRAAPEVDGLKSLSSSAGKNAEGPAEGSPEWAAGLRRRPSSKKQDEGDEVSADRSGQKAGCAAAAQQAMRSSAASRGDSTKELSRDSSGNQDVEHRRQRNELPREGCVGWGQRTVGKEEPFSQDDETISGGMSHPEGAERGAYPSDGPHSGDTSLSLHADRDSEVQRRTPSKEEQSKANVLSPSSPLWQKHAALCSALGRLERTETSSARGRSPKAGGLDQKSESDMDVLEEETTQKETENVGSGSSEARPTSECRDSGEAQAREGNSSVESEASHTFLPFVSSSSRTSPEEGLQLFFCQCRSSDRDQQSSDSRKRRAWEVEDTATPRALQEAREGSRVLEERAKDGNGNVPPLDLRGGNAGGTTERRSTFVSLEGIGLSRGSEHGKQNRGESVERLPTTGFPGSDGPAPTCGIKGDARAGHTDNFSLPSGSSLHLVGPDGLCLFGRSSSSVVSAWENRGAKRDSGDRGNSFSGAEAASRPSWEAKEQGKGLTSESLVVGERQIPGLPTVAQFSNSGNAHDAPSDSNVSGSARRSASAQTVAKRSPRPTTSTDSERQFDCLGSIIEAGLDSGGGHSESSVPEDIGNVTTHREKATGETVPQASSLQTTGFPSWSEIPGGPPVASCSSLRRTAGDNVPGGLPGEEQLSDEKRSSFVSSAPAGVSLSLLGSFGEGDGAQGQGNTAGEGRREHEPCGGLPRPRGGPEALSCDAPKAIFFSLSATESRVGEQNGETKQKEQVGPSSSVSAHHTVDAGEEEKAADPEDLAGGNQHLIAGSVRIAGGCLRPRPFPADKLRFGELDEKGEDKDRKPETSPPRAGGGNEGKGSFPPFRSSLSRSFSCDSSLFSVPLTDERSSASRSPPASSPGFERDGYTAVHTPETEEDQQASPPPNQTTLRESVTVEPGEDDPMSFLLPSPRAALEPVGCSPSSSEREAEVRERGSDGAGKDSKRRRRTEFPFSASAPFSFRRSLDEGKALFRGSTFFGRKGGGREEKEATAGLLPRAGSLDFSILSRRGNKKVCSFGILGSVALDTWRDEEGGLVTEYSPIETFRFNLTQTSHETGQVDVRNAVLNSPVFALFDVDEKRQILELLISSITHVTEECTIFHRGEKVDVLYFVERGELEMAAVGPDPENHAEEANLGEREESAVGSAPDSQEAELGNHRHSAMAFSVLQIPSGAFVLPRAFLRAGCTAYRVRAVKPSSLYKLTAQSFQTVANGAVLRRASDLLAYMLRCPILEALTKREASQLIPLMRWQQFLPNEIILHQEQISRTMLIVMKGKARGVRRLSRHGRPETLEYYEEGSCINYLCLLQELPNSTSVIAEQPEGCIVASLSASDFVGLMGSAERLLDRGQETADGGKGFSGRIDLGEVKKTWHKVLKMAGPR